LVGLLAAAECFAQEHKEHKVTAPIIVRMTEGLRFKPARVTIHAGDTVEWKNTSGVPHTVTADARRAPEGTKVVLPFGAKPFDSGNIKPGGSYRHTFTVPGTYKYICIPHAELGMTGEVIVQPRPAASTHPHTEAPPQPPREADGGPPEGTEMARGWPGGLHGGIKPGAGRVSSTGAQNRDRARKPSHFPPARGADSPEVTETLVVKQRVENRPYPTQETLFTKARR